MRDLVEFLARALVENPDAVEVTEVEENGDLILEVDRRRRRPRPADRPGGRVANAIRTIAKAASTGAEQRVLVEFELKIDVFTLFPDWFDWFLSQRHVRNAVQAGNELRLFNYRDTTPMGGGQVDDAPYGGGAGMVLRVDVVDAALDAAYADGREPSRVLVLAPSGPPARRRAGARARVEPHVALLSGRYEGIDERVSEHLATDAVSDRAVRPLGRRAGRDGGRRRRHPQASGALGHADSAVEESFSEALGRRARISALHAAGHLPGLEGPGGPAVRRSRARARVAPGAQPRAGRTLSAARLPLIAPSCLRFAAARLAATRFFGPPAACSAPLPDRGP